MSLQRYQRMRDFERTPEPRGAAPGAAPSTGALHFVVQAHDASALHYDFRLELDGVLKSWAVPKGPSDVEGEKRLAVHTEDHPVEYAEFEGTIPEGEYGAGRMRIWDEGTWVPESAPLAAFRRGHLKFELRGRRLKGHWSLVRMGNAQTRKKDLWLLVKRAAPAAKSAARSPRRKPAAGRGARPR